MRGEMLDATAAGQFRIGDTAINRLGYGAMRITGPGVWGPQNRYNLTDRASEDVLAYCTANNIGFIPWFPLAAGELTMQGGVVARIAKAHGATVGQVALAWLLRHSPVILPIPGTLRVGHLEENVAAASLSLTPEEARELDASA